MAATSASGPLKSWPELTAPTSAPLASMNAGSRTPLNTAVAAKHSVRRGQAR